MTRAPHAPRSSFSDLAEAVAVMRERGLRLSTPRRLILERLFAAAAPLSAEDLSGSLALDLAVTYRNLETLEANGLVHHVHLGHGPGLYALVGAGDHERALRRRAHGRPRGARRRARVAAQALRLRRALHAPRDRRPTARGARHGTARARSLGEAATSTQADGSDGVTPNHLRFESATVDHERAIAAPLRLQAIRAGYGSGQICGAPDTPRDAPAASPLSRSWLGPTDLGGGGVLRRVRVDRPEVDRQLAAGYPRIRELHAVRAHAVGEPQTLGNRLLQLGWGWLAIVGKQPLTLGVGRSELV
jgi:hypothetical protein